MQSNHLILCRPLLLPPSIFPSMRVFSNESVLCIRWPNYWSFSFSISPSNEYSGLISFRMDWFSASFLSKRFALAISFHRAPSPQPYPMSLGSPGLSDPLMYSLRNLTLRKNRKSLQAINAGEGVEKREPSYTVGGNANYYSHYGEQCGDSFKNWK